jgi:hypothetical protein
MICGKCAESTIARVFPDGTVYGEHLTGGFTYLSAVQPRCDVLDEQVRASSSACSASAAGVPQSYHGRCQ